MPKGIYNHKPHKGMFQKGGVSHNKGKTLSKEHKEKISKANLGRTYSQDVIERMSLGQKLRFQKSTAWNKGLGWLDYECLTCKETFKSKQKDRKYCSQKCYVKANSGEGNYRYIKDRKLIKCQDRRDNPLYKQWRKEVWTRDSWKCKLLNNDCNGRIEAHHIYNYKDFPQLRYEVSNGITLCHYHHPRLRSEEERLKKQFLKIVNSSVVSI